jgi:hypothetical protein
MPPMPHITLHCMRCGGTALSCHRQFCPYHMTEGLFARVGKRAAPGVSIPVYEVAAGTDACIRAMASAGRKLA